MRHLLSLFISLILFAGITTAFVSEAPSCVSKYTINNINFTYNLNNTNITCQTNWTWRYPIMPTAPALVKHAGGYARITTATTLFVPTKESLIHCQGTFCALSNGTNNVSCSFQSCILNITLLSDNTVYLKNPTSNITAFNNLTLYVTGGVGYALLPLNYTVSNRLDTQPSATVNSPDDNFPYIAYSATGVVRSDFTSGVVPYAVLPNGTAAVNLYYDNAILIPKITYIPNKNAMPNFRNITAGTAYFYNNTNMYILDETSSLWYLCPAYPVTDMSLVHTFSCLLLPSESSDFSIPILPIKAQCGVVGDQYIINYSYSTAVPFVRVKWNTTVSNSTSTNALTYVESINITTYPNINFTSYGQLSCRYNADDSILPSISNFNIEGMPVSIGFFIQAFIVVLGVVSVYYPFVLLFVIFLNDIFGAVDIATMGLLSVIVVILSLLSSTFSGGFSVKNLVIYALFLIALLVPMYGLIGYDSSPLEGLTVSFEAIGTSGNVATFILANVLFIVNLFVFLITLPAVFLTIIAAPLATVSPSIYSALVSIGYTLNLGAVLYLLLKAYETISDRQRNL